MDSTSLRFDSTISVESLVAAIGVLGAAIGYLLNLFKNWRAEYKDKKYLGTNSFILDMLEEHFYEGLSEDKLWQLYCSVDTLDKRQIYSAWKPTALGRIGFEKQLRHLQSRFLIRLTGNNHYHIDFQDQERWKVEAQRRQIEKISKRLYDKMNAKKLSQVLKGHLTNGTISPYRRADVYLALLKLDDEDVIDDVVRDLESKDKDKVESAIEIIRKLNERY